MLPLAVAVSVVMVRFAPVAPMFNVLVPALVNPPVPARAVATVSVPLLVKVTPVTVTLGMENVPVSAWELVLKVCTPVLAVKVPLFVMPLLKVEVTAALSVQFAPPLIVTRPVKVLEGFVAEEKVNVPDDPPPTVVVLLTVKVNAPTVRVVPSPTERLPVIVKLAAVVDVAVPLNVRLPPIAVVPDCKVLPPLPLRVRL